MSNLNNARRELISCRCKNACFQPTFLFAFSYPHFILSSFKCGTLHVGYYRVRDCFNSKPLGRSQIEAYCFWMPDCSFSEPRRESRPLPLFSNECSNDRKVSSRKIASPKGNKHKHNCAESVRKEVDNIQNRGGLMIFMNVKVKLLWDVA